MILQHYEIFNSGWQRSKSCEGTNFDPVDDTVTRHDYQEIKIQENTQVLGVGVLPRSILVVLKDDLVDNVKAGGTTPWLLFVFMLFCVLHIHHCITIMAIIPSLSVTILKVPT